MPQVRRIPEAPRVEAIVRVDALEELAEEFERENGYSPELVSHWDPKHDFEEEISRWVPESTPRTSLVRYVYSSYLEINDKVRRRLSEDDERAFIATPSGMTSVATVLTYLSNIGTRHLHVITPSYFAVEELGKMLGIGISFHEVARQKGRYLLPSDFDVQRNSAVWVTLPIYGASYYPPVDEVRAFLDNLPAGVIVVVDESLAYPDRNCLSRTRSMYRVLRIRTPHKRSVSMAKRFRSSLFPNTSKHDE